jgi:hypothetical protein
MTSRVPGWLLLLPSASLMYLRVVGSQLNLSTKFLAGVQHNHGGVEQGCCIFIAHLPLSFLQIQVMLEGVAAHQGKVQGPRMVLRSPLVAPSSAARRQRGGQSWS